MTIVQPLVQTPKKSIVRQLQRNSVGLVDGTWFTNFRETNDQYIQIPAITLPVNTQWKIDIVAAVPTQGAYLAADSTRANASSRFGMLKDGRTFGLSEDAGNIDGNTAGFLGGSQLRKYTAQNSGGTVEILIDGTRVNIFNDGSESPIINSFGRQHNGTTGVPPLLGVIASVLVEKAGTVVLDMPVNQKYTSNNNTVLDLSGNENHGTFVGIAEGDSLLYTKQGTDWVNGSTTLGGL